MKIIKISILAGTLWFFTSLIFGSIALTTYYRLSHEEAILTITFDKVNEFEYMANLIFQDGQEKSYLIYGDQWRVDARFIKLRPWANVLGADSSYNLERFEGRYKEIEAQNSKKYIAHDISRSTFMDIPDFFIDYNFIIDAEYGSSTYESIDVLREYTVFKAQSGILVRSRLIRSLVEEAESIFDKILKFLGLK